MGRALLALYRSAAQPVMAELGRDLERGGATAGTRPARHRGPRGRDRRAAPRAARRAGAGVATLDGLGHWWMTQDPARGARALARFWASLDHG